MSIDIIAQDKISIMLFNNTYSVTQERWQCSIEGERDNIKLKVTGKGYSHRIAIAEAEDKWSRVTGQVDEFKGPLLEYQPPKSGGFDDDIPF